jgi:hypothetical protein
VSSPAGRGAACTLGVTREQTTPVPGGTWPASRKRRSRSTSGRRSARHSDSTT